jgi:hypothetical protein
MIWRSEIVVLCLPGHQVLHGLLYFFALVLAFESKSHIFVQLLALSANEGALGSLLYLNWRYAARLHAI